MSLLFRTKKKLATATMNTKAGRKAVLALLGEEGNKVLDAIKTAIQKNKDEKTGKEKKKDMLKLALKLKILFDNGKLTTENTKHLSTPLMNLCNHVVDYLSPRETDWKDVEKKKATDDLVKEFAAVHKLLEEVLKEKMKPKNLEKLTSLVQTVGTAELLSKVREQKEYKDEKDVILANLEGLLLTEDAVNAGGKSQHCLAPGCHAPRVPEMKDTKPPFPGSELCSYHHYMKYEQLLREPDFNAWLNDEELRNIMNPFMVKEGQEKCLAFQVAVDNYTVISNPATRKTRAPKIVSKFFESKELQLDGAVVKQIKDAIAGTTPLSKTLFQPATDQVRKRMEKVFLDKFIKTKEYKDWAVTVALPESMATDIKKKLDEQTKKVDETQRKAEAALQAAHGSAEKKAETKKS